MNLAEYIHDQSIPVYMMDYVLDLTRFCQRAELIEVSDPETLAGPFAERYGLLTVRDCRFAYRPLQTIEEMRMLEYKTKKKYNLPYSGYRYEKVDPTVERPILIRLHGDDDFSWTVTAENPQEAGLAIDHLLACAPISVQEIIDYCGMSFTN